MLTKRDNMSLGCAGLAVAGTPANGAFKLTNALTYLIAGLCYLKAATDNIAQVQLPAAVGGLPFVNLGANQQTCIFVSIDVNGNLFLHQAARTAPAQLGASVFLPASITSSGYQSGAFEWPAEAKGYAVIGAIKIATNASGAFVFGTTTLSAANQTVTYYNAAVDYGVAVPY